MSGTSLYVAPRRNIKRDDCFFYHRMELPEIGEVGTQWELRNVTDNYLGNVDFAGKRVLDVGAASGFLTFEMEARGAEVVSFDMSDGADWNMVPYPQIQENLEELIKNRRRGTERLKNAYWFAHEKLNSQARVYYGDVYRLPEELGQFDIVFFGMILGHLRDPFQALYSGSRLCTGQVIVTNQALPPTKQNKPPVAYFMPDPQGGSHDCWWALSDNCIDRMLGVLGFETVNRIRFKAQCIVTGRHGEEDCAATIANRFAGEAEGMEARQPATAEA